MLCRCLHSKCRSFWCTTVKDTPNISELKEFSLTAAVKGELAKIAGVEP